MKASEIQKYQFPNCLVNWEKLKSTVQANIRKPQFSIISMNLEKLREFQLEQHSEIQIFNFYVN